MFSKIRNTQSRRRKKSENKTEDMAGGRQKKTKPKSEIASTKSKEKGKMENDDGPSNSSVIDEQNSEGSSNDNQQNPEPTNPVDVEVDESKEDEEGPTDANQGNPNSNNNVSNSGNWELHLLLGIAALVLCIVFGWLNGSMFLSASSSGIEVDSCTAVTNLSVIIRQLKERTATDIPKQDEVFWKTLSPPIKSVSSEVQRNPSCVVLAVSRSTTETTNKGSTECLSKHLECVIHGKKNTIYVDGSDFPSPSGRSQLDDKLSKHFDSEGRVAVIHNFDMMSFDSALILYRYCDDNDDPVYPNTMLLLTIHYDEGDQVSDYWLAGKLKKSWTDNPDDITPLLSRVGGMVTKYDTSAAEKYTCSV